MFMCPIESENHNRNVCDMQRNRNGSCVEDLTYICENQLKLAASYRIELNVLREVGLRFTTLTQLASRGNRMLPCVV